MIFEYTNKGDILYGVETYRFRYNGYAAADITLLNLIDDGAFVFEVKIEDFVKLSNSKLRSFSNASYDVKAVLKVEINAPIKDRHEALQMAINWTSHILEEYSDISTKIQNNSLS
jgi:hypothetical protein